MTAQPTLPAVQQIVSDFVVSRQLQTDVEARLLDLVSEVGELAKENLKATSYGRQLFASTSNWSAELGDAFFSLICLANATNVDLNDALNITLKKYQHRFALNGDVGSGA